MEQKYAKFKQSQILKSLGFNIPCEKFYGKLGKKGIYLLDAPEYDSDRYVVTNWNDGLGSYPTKPEDVECSAPEHWKVLKWLDIEFDRYIHVTKIIKNGLRCYVPYINGNVIKEEPFCDFDTKEEAESAAITVALEQILSNKTTENNPYVDKDGVKLSNGDIIDINQTVNGENKFIVLSLKPLDIRYHRDLSLSYEYDKEELLLPDPIYGTEIKIIGNINEILNK